MLLAQKGGVSKPSDAVNLVFCLAAIAQIAMAFAGWTKQPPRPPTLAQFRQRVDISAQRLRWALLSATDAAVYPSPALMPSLAAKGQDIKMSECSNHGELMDATDGPEHCCEDPGGDSTDCPSAMSSYALCSAATEHHSPAHA